MDSTILTPSFVNSYRGKTAPFGFNGLGYVVYKRTYSRLKEDGTQEEWFETVARCVNGAQKIGAGYTREEAERLYDHVFNLRCNFGGRMLWQLGTSTVERFGLASLLNCWWVSMREPLDFCFLFEHLMLGGGVGFSVKREDIHELPRVRKAVQITHQLTKDADYIVPDSRQGWVKLLSNVLDAFYVTGQSFTYSTVLIRGAGEKINGFGGTASGPQILIDGIEKIITVFRSREGKKLRSIDVLDICNIIGSVVVAGNVRRSAEVAIGDPDDFLYLNAKRWDLGNIPNWRSMSNNSIYADDFSHISDQIWEGYRGNGEPYGFMNLPLCQAQGRLGEARRDNCEGGNPCQPAWAPVLTPSGLSTMGVLKVGDRIWSETGWTTVVAKAATGVKPVFRYQTTAGAFYGTENHRLVSSGEKVEAKDAESVDRLVGPFVSELVLDPQDVMDGIVFGDGTVHEASNDLIVVHIGKDDGDYHLSEVGPFIRKQRLGICDTCWTVTTTIQPAELPLTFNRSIPKRYVYGSQAKAAAFLRGLYTANGSIVADRITLKASSFKVIEQVQLMLSSLGIASYYTTNRPQQVRFSNGDYLCKQSYDLNITRDRDAFAALIGFVQLYKVDKVDALLKQTRRSSRTPKVTYDIVSSEQVSVEEVYDITVDNDPHTYWTGGLNVSNCMEITLCDGEACNLCELYLNNITSQADLIDCAQLLYKTQKAIWTLPALYEKTAKIVRKNMRVGLGVTGVCQSPEKLDWLDKCYVELRRFDREWSKQRGWPESIKLTTIKPSGTLSLLGGATPGVHPAYSKHYIRRVRMSSGDKLVKVCRDAGYHVEYVRNFDNSEDHSTVVVEFPCWAGEKATVAKDMTAIDQLELVKRLQTVWSDNSVSVTVYYRPDELDGIKGWLKKNYKTGVKTVSFLLHSDHGFKQAPYGEITEAEYVELAARVKPIAQTSGDAGGAVLDVEGCSGGVCPVR